MPDFTQLVQTGGLLMLALIIFAESGMMVGFFFPGDTLLFSAGILAAAGHLPIIWTVVVIALAAIIGDNTGYHIGKHLGPRLFKKEDGLIFRKDLITKTEQFYEKHGSKTMLIAHFVPVVRSFAPVTAGAGKMNYKQFVVYDAIGDIAWAASITLLGFFLGSRIPGVEKMIEPVLLGIVAITLIPTLYHAFKDPKIRAKLLRRKLPSYQSRVKSADKE
ncbi:VTT domain-containing protein [Candidatus Saccharibacteria bacterium]|jgi:membrane-associated protein|nr:VTT domain-containing protein [Candidatus Saccharibacteria bacterium]HPR09152.1 VTT domain-containing protein [Candidatus Saccharibacteria bacterium]